jgi:uncharacterized protein with LGFP repeats
VRLAGNGCVQAFQCGRGYTTPGSGTHAHRAILDAWAEHGYERGPPDYPTFDPYAAAGGTALDFQGGELTFGTATRS